MLELVTRIFDFLECDQAILHEVSSDSLESSMLVYLQIELVVNNGGSERASASTKTCISS